MLQIGSVLKVYSLYSAVK